MRRLGLARVSRRSWQGWGSTHCASRCPRSGWWRECLLPSIQLVGGSQRPWDASEALLGGILGQFAVHCGACPRPTVRCRCQRVRLTILMTSLAINESCVDRLRGPHPSPLLGSDRRRIRECLCSFQSEDILGVSGQTGPRERRCSYLR